MNEDIKLKILNKIKEYNRIIICRHIRPDGDAAGSTLGPGAYCGLPIHKKRYML